jgi:glycosyltransferase involved in cell wall biosynthesis
MIQMQTPIVSFIVPCYKLAHFLFDCVESILCQTYDDFEVLIMDDCSPDHTPEVAQAFQDVRVRHIRNDENLGHLRNYNKGVSLARGRYVWLISADDQLRRAHILERYVRLMGDHPNVGYVFCPGIGLENGVETDLLEYYYYGAVDKIFDGRRFITTVLRKGGGLLSPSVMVRRDCYEKVSMFPLDMPHQGDVYLWFRWALEYDVGYLSEPMVNYRSHEGNMMKYFLGQAAEAAFTDEVNVLWRIKQKAEEKGYVVLARQIECSLASKYAHAAAFAIYGKKCSPWPMNLADCEAALYGNARNISEIRRLRAIFYAVVADKHWHYGTARDARQGYLQALQENWQMPRVWLKLLFASMGRRTGTSLRNIPKRIA